jgi:hypothetical protein
LGAFTTRRATTTRLSPSPASISAAACRMYPISFLFGGRSFRLAIFPNDPIAPACTTPSSRSTLPISAPQKPKLQCALNAEMLHKIVPP